VACFEVMQNNFSFTLQPLN